MNSKKTVILLLVGVLIWAVATLVFKFYGSFFFESSMMEYWLNLVITIFLYTSTAFGLLKLLQVDQKYWLQGALCIALPGMLGEIPVLINFGEFMSSMASDSAGKYAAFLFAGYVCVIGFFWLIDNDFASNLKAKSSR